MTLQEMQLANHGFTIEPTRLDLPEFGVKFSATPQNVFNESVPRPLQAGDYNGISIAQMEDFSKGAHMDGLHRLDALAVDHAKGKAYKAMLDVDIQQSGKELGTKKFLSRFTKPK